MEKIAIDPKFEAQFVALLYKYGLFQQNENELDQMSHTEAVKWLDAKIDKSKASKNRYTIEESRQKLYQKHGLV